MRRALFAAIALTATLAVVGCQKPQEAHHEACAPGDSPQLCKEVQECFNSGTSVEVCREGEKIAADYSHYYQTHIAPLNNGAADALNYDPSKASQKPATKQQPQQQQQLQPKKP